ncbi:hypothetical protein E4U54_002485 [Claviceps lovelessii]|nr:hypothetical protein E4U54_002485 [Claviceps lovelessii]
MVCTAGDLSRLMIGYQQFRPTSAEVRRERKRIAQRKYRKDKTDIHLPSPKSNATPEARMALGNSLRLRSEVAQVNDTCEAGDGESGWRVDLDREGGEATNGSTSRGFFEVQGLQRADTSLMSNYRTVDSQTSHDDADADWCCVVGNGRDSLSPTNTIDARRRHLQLQRKPTDCPNGSVDSRAGRQLSGCASASGHAQPLQSILFQMPDNVPSAVENTTDHLREADEGLEFVHSSVDEMDGGQESSVSSAMSHLSQCPPEALASIKSAGPAAPFLASGSRTTAFHDADFGLNSTEQDSTTAGTKDYRSIRPPGQKQSQWDCRRLIRDAFVEPEPPTNPLHSPDVTFHKPEDQMTAFASITSPVRTEPSSLQGMSPLFQAAMTGNVKILSIMVQNSVYPEMVNQDGQTILHIAAQNGHCDEVEFLISLGFDVNAQDGQGNTALHLAISHGWEKMVEVLVEAGADVDGLNYK